MRIERKERITLLTKAQDMEGGMVWVYTKPPSKLLTDVFDLETSVGNGSC